MTAAFFPLVACRPGGDGQPRHGGARVADAPSTELPPAGATPPEAVVTRDQPVRDPVQLTATAEVDGKHYAVAGLGECQHTGDASIYEVPAAMWSARLGNPAGEIQYLNLTLWQPKASAEVQGSLGLTAGSRTHEIATVTGAPIRGRGRARVEPAGPGGALDVEGTDAEGRQVRLHVDCTRFTEPVAEGG